MYAVRPADPVQKQQTVGVVDLVLERNSLETVRDDLHPLPGQRQLTANDNPPAPGDVPGEVRHRHTPLATAFLASGADDHPVAQGEKSVTRAGLGMAGDVDGEDICGHADLLGREPYAAGRDELGGKEVRDELDRCGVCRVDVPPGGGEHRVRGPDDPANSACGQP
jgi:hypothetical protein